MIPAYKITPTLLNSFMFLQGSKEADRAEQETRFIGTLQKLQFESTLPILKGNELEQLIEARNRGVPFQSLQIKALQDIDIALLEDVVESLAAFTKGGSWQVKVGKDLYCPDTQTLYHVYGKVDVIFPSDTIFDIKYTGKKRLYKFATSSQHRLYMDCADIDKFSYLISDGSSWWREDYSRNKGMDHLFLLNTIKAMRIWINEREEAKLAFDKHWQFVK